MPLVQIDPQHHIQCFACQSLYSGPAYACTTCNHFLHKSCAELPLLIQHPAHSFHPLFLRINKRDPPQVINHSFYHHTLIYRDWGFYCCDSCHKYFSGAPGYRCYECNFDLDVKCALMETIRCEGQKHIEHFSHQHPMPLVQIDPQHHIQCACQSLCLGPAYACTACEYFLHKSCAELPREILFGASKFEYCVY
ncbi:hypothetical protein UlMin_009116 [Ulmus minor]